MNREKDVRPKLPKKSPENPVIGSYFEQVVFEQSSIERAREITDRLLQELKALGVSVDPRTGEVRIKAQNEAVEPKS